jgi:DNA modification methylase
MTEVDDESVTLIVTSPPYNIGVDYGNFHKNGRVVKPKGKKYADSLPEEEYREMLRQVFSECKRVLKSNGSIWLNIKNRFIDGVIVTPFWMEEFFKDMFLKNVVIWNFDWGGATEKRLSPRYEYIFWFTKSKDDRIFNLDEIKIPTLNYRPDRFKSQWKNPTDVWYIQMVSGNYLERTSHPAQYPEELIERIVKLASNPGDVVLDPFIGSGTTARVAKDLGRSYIGYEIDSEYVRVCQKRLEQPFHRHRKRTADIRPLYFYASDEEIMRFSKENARR